MRPSSLNEEVATRLRARLCQVLSDHFPSDPCDREIVHSPERSEFETEMRVLRTKLLGKSWKDVKGEDLPRPFDSVHLLTESAFAKLFPAYLRAVCIPEGLSQEERRYICDLVRWSIPNPAEGANNDELLRDSWWEGLNTKQRNIVVAVITVGQLQTVPFALGEFLTGWLDWSLANDT